MCICVRVQGDKRYGVMCLAGSLGITALGVTLMFNKFLMRIGNVSQHAVLIGPDSDSTASANQHLTIIYFETTLWHSSAIPFDLSMLRAYCYQLANTTLG